MNLVTLGTSLFQWCRASRLFQWQYFFRIRTDMFSIVAIVLKQVGSLLTRFDYATLQCDLQFFLENSTFCKVTVLIDASQLAR